MGRRLGTHPDRGPGKPPDRRACGAKRHPSHSRDRHRRRARPHGLLRADGYRRNSVPNVPAQFRKDKRMTRMKRGFAANYGTLDQRHRGPGQKWKTVPPKTMAAEVIMAIQIPVLGVAVVDQDHQDAVTLIEMAMTADESELAELLNKAAAHLAEHFRREEALMDECGFFAAHCHKAEHARVLDEVANVQEIAVRDDLAVVRHYLTSDFPAWLLEHASSMDTVTMASYRSFLRQ